MTWLGGPTGLWAIARATVVVSGLALLSACASSPSPSLPLPPTPGPAASIPPVPELAIAVHLSATYPAMSAAASNTVPVKFANINATTLGAPITFTLVGTRSPITLSRSGAKIGFSTNVDLAGAIGTDCGPIANCTAGLHLTGLVTGAALPTIQPDWTLHLDFAAQYQLAGADLSFPFVPQSISLKDQLNLAMKPAFNGLIALINAQVAKSPMLKTDAATAWSALGPPTQVSASPPVWLVIHPTRILAQEPVITDQGVEMGVALMAQPELIVGDKPAAQDPGALPNLTVADQVPQQFNVYLPVKLTWDSANQLATQMIVGKTLSAGPGVTVHVDQISIFNNGDELGVKVMIRANGSNMTIYMLGKPIYDLDKGYIALTNLHLDISTQNMLLQFATWMTHQVLVADLQSRLRFDVKSQFEERRQDLEKAINGAQVNPRLSLSGQVISLAPSAVYLTGEGMQVNVVATGTLNAVLH